MNGTVGATQPSIDLPAQRRGKVTARVVVGKTGAAVPSAAVDTPSPPPPIGTPVKPEREASGAKALQPITESVVAPATPAEAAKQSPTFLMTLLGGVEEPSNERLRGSGLSRDRYEAALASIPTELRERFIAAYVVRAAERAKA
jgi:hypothetical protein